MDLLEPLGSPWADLGTTVVAAMGEGNLQHAVILETTGDMSVLQGDGPFDPELLQGVRGAERLEART